MNIRSFAKPQGPISSNHFGCHNEISQCCSTAICFSRSSPTIYPQAEDAVRDDIGMTCRWRAVGEKILSYCLQNNGISEAWMSYYRMTLGVEDV